MRGWIRIGRRDRARARVRGRVPLPTSRGLCAHVGFQMRGLSLCSLGCDRWEDHRDETWQRRADQGWTGCWLVIRFYCLLAVFAYSSSTHRFCFPVPALAPPILIFQNMFSSFQKKKKKCSLVIRKQNPGSSGSLCSGLTAGISNVNSNICVYWRYLVWLLARWCSQPLLLLAATVCGCRC